jgi:hypothetical protein
VKPVLQNSVSSPQDLKQLVLEIRKFAQWFSQDSIKKQVSARNLEMAPVISPAASELINNLGAVEPLSQKAIDGLLATLEGLEATTPCITLTLAAPPPGDLKKALLEWFRQHIAANLLIDFRFNSTLLGGIVVQFDSHIYDLSFRRQILVARERFPEVLRRV